MDRHHIQVLQERLATEQSVDAGLQGEIAEALETAFPGISLKERMEGATLSSVDGILHLLAVLLPDWTISLQGTAHDPDRHWRCTLRRTTSDDDDEMIGHGSGPRLAPALLTALLGLAAIRAGH